jgi:hypothetical protein
MGEPCAAWDEAGDTGSGDTATLARADGSGAAAPLR